GAVHSRPWVRGLLCSLQQYLHVLFIITVCSVTFSVSTDRNITAQVGDPVTLPCYANVGKQANLSHLNIRWEKDGQTVLDIQSGTGSGFKNRVSLSPDRVRVGDLSLTISAVLFSDRGAYRCFFSNDIGTPEGIILSIAGKYTRVCQSLRNVSQVHCIVELIHYCSFLPQRCRFS
uniref:Ig-like domain-containing protein n=1 Tax=Scleropages formosus TaxID=113540 RepID=A0A8C9VX63_SCLFO